MKHGSSNFRFLVVAILATLTIGCDHTAGAADGAKNPDSEFYSLSVSPGEIPVGQEVKVVVGLNPTEAYKWNQEYPARFTLDKVEGLELAASEFSKANSGIVSAEKNAVLNIGLKATQAGTYNLPIHGNFSVCNDTSCKIFRSAELKLELKAR